MNWNKLLELLREEYLTQSGDYACSSAIRGIDKLRDRLFEPQHESTANFYRLWLACALLDKNIIAESKVRRGDRMDDDDREDFDIALHDMPKPNHVQFYYPDALLSYGVDKAWERYVGDEGAIEKKNKQKEEESCSTAGPAEPTTPLNEVKPIDFWPLAHRAVRALERIAQAEEGARVSLATGNQLDLDVTRNRGEVSSGDYRDFANVYDGEAERAKNALANHQG